MQTRFLKGTLPTFTAKMWSCYARTVARNLSDVADLSLAPSPDVSMDSLRERMFASFLLYVFPLSFIALIPGVAMALTHEKSVIGVAGPTAVGMLAISALVPGLSKRIRWALVFAALYGIGTVLIWRLDAPGGGLLYYMAVAMFIALVVRGPVVYGFLFLSYLTCLLPFGRIFSFGEHVAIASNLLLLGTTTALCIQRLLSWLEVNNEKLARTNEDLREIVFATSHHLREPVHKLNCAYSLLVETDSDSQRNELHSLVQSNSKLMLRQLDALRDLAAICGSNLDMQRVDLDMLIREVFEDWQASASHDERVCSDVLPPVLGDRQWIREMFDQLYRNVREHGTRPVNIQVGVSHQSKSQIEIYFRSSTNRTPTDIDRMLLPFAKDSDSTGAGLGLACCRRIVEAHGGSLTVHHTNAEWLEFRFGFGVSPIDGSWAGGSAGGYPLS